MACATALALCHLAYCVAAVAGLMPSALHAANVVLRTPWLATASAWTLAHAPATALGACCCFLLKGRTDIVLGTGIPYCAASCCTSSMYACWLACRVALVCAACLAAARRCNRVDVTSAMRTLRKEGCCLDMVDPFRLVHCNALVHVYIIVG